MAAKWLKKLGESLKSSAPMIVGGLGTAAGTAVGGPLGAMVGPVLANIMRKVTGAPVEDTDFEAMAEQIMGSPELQLELEKLAIERERMYYELEVAKLTAETKLVESVNATMRAEAGSDKWYQAGWRPYCGFVMGTAWGIIALSFAILVACVGFNVGGVQASALTGVGSAMSDMAVFFSIMLAVLGISSWKRGDEKIARASAKGTVLSAITD